MHALLCMSVTTIGFEPMTPLDRPYLQMIAVGFTDKQHESQKYIPGALPAELHRHILFFNASVDKSLKLIFTN